MDKISTWREGGGQPFLDVTELQGYVNHYGFQKVPDVRTAPLPTSIADTLEWLKAALPKSLCPLDDGAQLNPEGVVVRSCDRKKIAKIRYEDYIKTVRVNK